MADQNSYDVIIIGSGISGVNAGYRVQEGLPNSSYAILEGREEMGGTWSLFKYPGIRSDSDLHTFGFPWDPWTEDRAIADAPSILKYIKSVASRHGIDKNIKFRHMVEKLDWKSDQQRWQLEVTVNGSQKKTFYARFILMGTGYYDYKEPLAATIPGLQNFKGTVVHPQFWPEDLDYTDKRVVIIGSGATAVTILPAMNDQARSVTMLQRSPGYFFAPPVVEPINLAIKKWLPASVAHKVIRWRFMVMGFLFFQFCRAFPNFTKKMFVNGASKALPKNIQADPNFIPNYNPWQQRMCITPGGDFFQALRTGKSDVVTGHIDTVTALGIKLQSGRVIEADIIITATGLKIQLGGNAKMSVDGQPLDMASKFVWKGALLQDVPNFAFVFGYTNASWTLGADATARLFVRLVKKVGNSGMTSVVPRLDNEGSMKEVPMLNLNSTYIKSAMGRRVLPKGGDSGPWVPRSNYFRDLWNATWGSLSDGLQFYRVATD